LTGSAAAKRIVPNIVVSAHSNSKLLRLFMMISFCSYFFKFFVVLIFIYKVGLTPSISFSYYVFP
jgi:hypothetical protein